MTETPNPLLPIVRSVGFVYKLTWLVAALLSASSIVGLLYGKEGWYDAAASTFPALLGQDGVTLVLAVPLLLCSAWLAHRRGSTRALLCWTGTLFYVAYFYYFYIVGIRFNVFFPLYIALVSTSMFGVLALFVALDLEALKNRFSQDTPVGLIGSFLVGSSLAFAALWLTLIVSAIASRRELDDVSRFVIAIDGVVLLPLSFWGGLWLRRRDPLGYAVGGILLMKFAATFLTLIVTTAVTARSGQPISLLETVMYSMGMLGAAALLVRFLSCVDVQQRTQAPNDIKSMEFLSRCGQIVLHVALGPLLHHWRTHWGATRDEIERMLPGDELIPAPDWSYTRAITIEKPIVEVWPLLVQIGQKRGGLYSHEGFENMIGRDIYNIREMQFQPQESRKGGGPPDQFNPPIVLIKPGWAIVLGGPPDSNGSGATWSFYLLEGRDGSTRLLERGRGKVGKGISAKLAFGPYLMDPVGFVLSRKMLRTIKTLAENNSSSH